MAMITEKISSLQELLEVLPQCSGKDYVDIVKGMTLKPSEFADYIFWNKNFYTRNCIARNNDYELLLLCWEQGQITPIHCHGGQECWVYMLQGSIEEKRYEEKQGSTELEVVQTTQMSEGKFSYMNDDMGLHSLRNTHPGQAMSLHLYMNPIDECSIYDPATRERENRKLQYHTFKGQPMDVLK